MPTITVFLPGHNHEDPAPKHLLLDEIARAKAAGIPTMVLAEAPCSLSLQQSREHTEKKIASIEDILDVQRLVQAELKKAKVEVHLQLMRGMLPPKVESEFINACRNKEFFTPIAKLRSLVSQITNKHYDPEILQMLQQYPVFQLRLKVYQ